MQHPNQPIILSVKDITLAIKNQLEPLFRHIWIRGEISNLREQASGHLYFSLVESQYQLAAVIFRTEAAALPSKVKNGDTVIAYGEISVYPPRGTYQLIIHKLSFLGLGDALLALQALKTKCTNLGWFAQERKRPLPKEISTIGVITSPSGAVIRDIITIVTRRARSYTIIINPVRVQGEGAAQEIAHAIDECNRVSIADVLIVCRGGGSAEDLAAFNDERVAQACVNSTIPIIAAIGHETDLSITDLVADIRAPTPSAAAELVSKERVEQQDRLHRYTQSLQQVMCSRMQLIHKRLHAMKQQWYQQTPAQQVHFFALRLDDLENSLRSSMTHTLQKKHLILQKAETACISPSMKIEAQYQQLLAIHDQIRYRYLNISQDRRHRLTTLIACLHTACKNHVVRLQTIFQMKQWPSLMHTTISHKVSTCRYAFDSMQKALYSIHPHRTLERGYAIISRTPSDQVIRSIADIQPSDMIRITMADGSFIAKVQHKEQAS